MTAANQGNRPLYYPPLTEVPALVSGGSEEASALLPEKPARLGSETSAQRRRIRIAVETLR